MGDRSEENIGIHHPESDIECLDNEEILDAWLRLSSHNVSGARELGPETASQSGPLQLLPNTSSNLRVSAFSENYFTEIAPSADMETRGSSTALDYYYPPTLTLDPLEQSFRPNCASVLTSYEREDFLEWAEDMATPGYDFHSYNTANPDESPAESSMTATRNDYTHLSYLTHSHVNEQQYLNPSLQDQIPLRAAYGISDLNNVSHRMHVEPSNSMPLQSFESFEQGLQPISSRSNRHLEMTTPVVPAPDRLPRRSLRLNPSTVSQLSHGDSASSPIAPLVASYYDDTTLVDAPNSPAVCRVHSPFVGSTSHDPDDYLQGPVSAESPSTMSQGTMEFPTPSLSTSQLERAVPTGGLHFNSTQSFRGPEQHFWGPPRHNLDRWSHTEPSSPAEDVDTGIHGEKFRRSSLKTCELEEAGLDFPGCYVLVPTMEEPATTEATVIEGPEPGLISTRKNFRRPMVESERQAIKLNRKYGVCLRCKMFKERCRGGLPCDRCRSLKLWKNICVTAHFADKSIFSRGLYKARVAVMLENVREWLPQDFHHQEIIEVSNGYLPKLSITLQKFDPFDESLLEHILWRELRKTDFARIPSTPYGIIEDIPSEKLASYFDEHINHLVIEIQQNMGTTVFSRTHAQTLFCAHKYTVDNQETGSLIRKALRIWAAQIVFFKGPFRICGRNAAGMPTINDPKSTVYGITPLPRLANQQLDARVESWMDELEQEVLAELQVKIFRRNPADWFGIYLVLFVLLSSLERDSWGLQTWMVDSNSLLERVKTLNLKNPLGTQKTWTWPLQELPAVLIEKNLRLAATLAAHFRSVTKGYVPFTLDWYSDPVILMAGGEEVAVQYMRTIGQWVKDSDQALRTRSFASYSKEVFDSLSLLYCSKLMISEDT